MRESFFNPNLKFYACVTINIFFVLKLKSIRARKRNLFERKLTHIGKLTLMMIFKIGFVLKESFLCVFFLPSLYSAGLKKLVHFGIKITQIKSFIVRLEYYLAKNQFSKFNGWFNRFIRHSHLNKSQLIFSKGKLWKV
jgi:hypothetical protein